MMCEKRFTTDYSDFLKNAKTFIKMDNERLTYDEIVNLLNDQQCTISALKEENIELKKLRKYCAEWMGVKEENLYDVVR